MLTAYNINQAGTWSSFRPGWVWKRLDDTDRDAWCVCDLRTPPLSCDLTRMQQSSWKATSTTSKCSLSRKRVLNSFTWENVFYSPFCVCLLAVERIQRARNFCFKLPGSPLIGLALTYVLRDALLWVQLIPCAFYFLNSRARGLR